MKWEELHNDAIIQVLDNLQNDVAGNIQVNIAIIYDKEIIKSFANNTAD